MSSFFADTKDKAANTLEKGADKIRDLPPMVIPAYSDIAKAANDLLNKDFYHVAAANLEVKTKAPNGVAYTIKGKSQHEKAPTASLEGKYAAKDTGIIPTFAVQSSSRTTVLAQPAMFVCMFSVPQKDASIAWKKRKREKKKKSTNAEIGEAEEAADEVQPGAAVTERPTPQRRIKSSTAAAMHLLMRVATLGMTGTVAWSSMNLIDAKIEADNNIAKGLKIEALANFKPDTQDFTVKSNAYFKHGPANLRLMADLMKQTTNFDLVFGQQGFLVGGEAGYDVQKAAISRYSATEAYQQAAHTAAVTASNSFSIFTASLYNKVNAETEIGIKATWDSKSSSTVGMDFAAKYKLDPLSFVKGKIDDRGVAAVSYNTKLNSNLTFGVGTSFDTQKLNEGTHKVGCHFAFDG